jgi:hypothetical protein
MSGVIESGEISSWRRKYAEMAIVIENVNESAMSMKMKKENISAIMKISTGISAETIEERNINHQRK